MWATFRIKIILCSILLTGCGYHFQGTVNPLRELGVHTIYVEGFRNLTYRPGIEHFFSTALIREIGRAKAFTLVNKREDADAILSGVVLGFRRSQSVRVEIRVEDDLSHRYANQFTTSVQCTISLLDRDGRGIFTRNFSGSRVHPGLLITDPNEPDKLVLRDNVTAPLVNESVSRLVTRFLADEMMSSAYQQIIDVF